MLRFKNVEKTKQITFLITLIFNSPFLQLRAWFPNLETGVSLAKWILEFLGIRGMNFHGKFGLGIPRNSQP